MKKKLLLLPVIAALLAFGAFALLFRPAKGAEIDRRMEAQVDTWQQAQAARPTEITGEEKGTVPGVESGHGGVQPGDIRKRSGGPEG